MKRLLMVGLLMCSFSVYGQMSKQYFKTGEQEKFKKFTSAFNSIYDDFQKLLDKERSTDATKSKLIFSIKTKQRKKAQKLIEVHQEVLKLKAKVLKRYEINYFFLVTDKQLQERLSSMATAIKELYPIDKNQKIVDATKDRFKSLAMFNNSENLISVPAYNEKIAKDFAYLIIGDNSPQQGISAVVNDKSTSIKINGVILKKRNHIITTEADLAATNGVYFFDEERGGTQAKISINYFRNIWAPSAHPGKKLVKKVIQDSILHLIETSYSEFEHIYALLVDQEVDNSLSDEVKKTHTNIQKKIIKLTHRFINKQEHLGLHNLRLLPFSEKPYLGEDHGRKTYNLVKLRAAFLKRANYIKNTLEKNIIAMELRNSDDQWSLERIAYFGFSPYYQRESFKRFIPQDEQPFANLFTEEKGDLMGATFSMNMSWHRTDSYNTRRWKHLPLKRIFMRGLASFARASNFSKFKTVAINQESAIVGTGNISTTLSETAFVGETAYDFGNSVALAAEVYYYPFDVALGLFGRIGYQYINFSSDKDTIDQEISPMRLGIIYNINNKVKDKPVVVLQAFLDRTDLSLSPNGNDDDLRFGFGVGLPIYFR